MAFEGANFQAPQLFQMKVQPNMKKNAISPTGAEEKVLQALIQHPYLDPFWLGEYLNAPNQVSKILSRLRKQGYAERWTFTREQIAVRSVWNITPAGVSALDQKRELKESELVKTNAYSRGRMTWMLLNLERVTQVRRFMSLLEDFNSSRVGPRESLALKPIHEVFCPAWKWQVISWYEEITTEGKQGKQTCPIPFHAGVTLQHCENERLLYFLIEYDNLNIPVEAQRERFLRFLTFQNKQQNLDANGNLLIPALVVVMQNDDRLIDSIKQFREIAHRYRLSLPGCYLTTEAEIDARGFNPAERIWYNINVGERRIFLEDERGWGSDLDRPHWRYSAARVKAKTPVLVAPVAEKTEVGVTSDDLAAVNLAVRFMEEKLLRLIAAHPLLSEQEMANLTNRHRQQIQASLKKLTGLGLIEKKIAPSPGAVIEAAAIESDRRKFARKIETQYYTTTERGDRFLAAVDGFGTALVRYRKAKLWSPDQTKRLIREWAHTRLGNTLFVKLAQAARTRGLHLDWFSEMESRLYFSVNAKQHAFLPDGRGILRANGQAVHFVVEIDTARSNAGKIRRKLARYYAAAIERILPENPKETHRMLMVTHSPERMRHLLELANQVEAKMDSGDGSLRRIAPVFFGHHQMIVYPGIFIDRPIWIDPDGQHVYCFPQFEPVEPAPDTRRTGRVSYRS